MDESGAVEELVRRAAGGDTKAWEKLWCAVEPRLTRLTRSARIAGRLSQSEDDRRNIVVEVMARLQDRDFRRLKLFLERRELRPDLEFEPWLTVVAKRVVIDYIRAHPDYVDRRHSRGQDSAPGRWIHLKTLPPASYLGGGRPPVTNRGMAMEMLHFAYRNLPAEQLTALERWIVGASYEAIAEELDLDAPDDAHKLVRSALGRLRRKFRKKGAS